MKKALSLLLVLVMALSLVTMTSAETEYAKEITIATTISNLDPGITWNATHEQYQQLVFDTLLWIDPATDEAVMQLAKSVEWVDDTHMQLHVILKDGLLFSDGTPLTATDVEFSLTRHPVTYIADYYASCDIVSDTELYINLKVPSTDFLTYLGWACGSIVSKAATEANPEGLALIGSGPYKYDMDTYIAKSSITLTTNEYYWGEATPTQIIHLVMLSDASAAAVALQNGEIDYYQNFGDSNLPALEADPNVEVTRYTSTNFIYMGFNDHRDTTLVTEEEVNFRRAVACAINKEDIVAGLGGGFVMTSMLGYDHPAYIANESDYPDDLSYNPEKAKEYLAKAGGRKEFNCLVDSSRSWCVLSALVVQEYLRQVGITMNIVETDGTGFTSMCKWDVYDYDAQIYSNLYVARNSGYNLVKPKVAANRVCMNNPVVNEAIDKIITGANQEVKNEQWKIIQREVHDKVSFLPLVFRQMNYATTKGVQGIKLATYGPTWRIRDIVRVIGG